MYDEERLKEIYREIKDTIGSTFTQREFLQFCYEWDETCEKVRIGLERRKGIA